MPGNAQTPNPQGLPISTATEAAEKITGTGTSLDNTIVPLTEEVDPDTGLPLEQPRQADVQAISTALHGSSALYSGTLSATTTAAALPSQACSEVYVQSDPANTATVLVGNATAQPLALLPGNGASIQVSNANLVYVKVASGTATVNWLARS